MWTPRALSEERERRVYWWWGGQATSPSPLTSHERDHGGSANNPLFFLSRAWKSKAPSRGTRGQSRGALCPLWGTVSLEICGLP